MTPVELEHMSVPRFRKYSKNMKMGGFPLCDGKIDLMHFIMSNGC